MGHFQVLTHPHLLKQPVEKAAPVNKEIKKHLTATALLELHNKWLTMFRLFVRCFSDSLPRISIPGVYAVPPEEERKGGSHNAQQFASDCF